MNKRVLVKFSGEALAGAKGYGIDPVTVDSIAAQIQEVLASELEIAIVNGVCLSGWCSAHLADAETDS